VFHTHRKAILPLAVVLLGAACSATTPPSALPSSDGTCENGRAVLVVRNNLARDVEIVVGDAVVGVVGTGRHEFELPPGRSGSFHARSPKSTNPGFIIRRSDVSLTAECRAA